MKQAERLRIKVKIAVQKFNCILRNTLLWLVYIGWMEEMGDLFLEWRGQILDDSLTHHSALICHQVTRKATYQKCDLIALLIVILLILESIWFFDCHSGRERSLQVALLFGNFVEDLRPFTAQKFPLILFFIFKNFNGGGISTLADCKLFGQGCQIVYLYKDTVC